MDRPEPHWQIKSALYTEVLNVRNKALQATYIRYFERGMVRSLFVDQTWTFEPTEAGIWIKAPRLINGKLYHVFVNHLGKGYVVEKKQSRILKVSPRLFIGA